MKIVTVLGARPQFIKAGTFSRKVIEHGTVEEILIHTGQHFDPNMSEIFFRQMRIPKPKYILRLGGGSHGSMTGKMITDIEEILLKEKPDKVLVYGDTNSTLAGALSSVKLNIPVAHVEAGLRSFNMNMPEEINRIVTDRVSSYLFCPTRRAVANLQSEGFMSFDVKVVQCGDIMKEGAFFYKELSQKPDIKVKRNFVLATIHRAENTDNPVRLKEIVDALNIISAKDQVILPIHPRTKKILEGMNIPVKFDIVEPVGYLEMIWLINNSQLVITDSGGLQKEAFFFKKPCVVLRDETEWQELVDSNHNCLVGADKQRILEALETFSFNNDFDVDFFGAGNTADIIHEILSI